MKTYTIVKPLYNERSKRVLEPGELIDFDDQQAAVLMDKGYLDAIVEPGIVRARQHKYQLEPELDGLRDSDF